MGRLVNGWTEVESLAWLGFAVCGSGAGRLVEAERVEGAGEEVRAGGGAGGTGGLKNLQSKWQCMV